MRRRRQLLRLWLLGGLGLLHVALVRPVAVRPALEASPRGGRLSGLQGSLAGRELAFFHPEGWPQSCPCAVSQRSRNLRLITTLLWRFGPQEDHECLDQLALLCGMELCVSCALHFTQRQRRGRRASKLRQPGLKDSNLSADPTGGLRVRPTRCCALRRGLGREVDVAPLPNDHIQPPARVVFIKGHHQERLMWLRQWGSPRSGHIHTALIQPAMHRHHVVLPGLLCGQVITEEGTEGGRPVISPLSPLFVSFAGSLGHVNVSCKRALGALSTRLLLCRSAGRGCCANQGRVIARSGSSASWTSDSDSFGDRSDINNGI